MDGCAEHSIWLLVGLVMGFAVFGVAEKAPSRLSDPTAGSIKNFVREGRIRIDGFNDKMNSM